MQNKHLQRIVRHAEACAARLERARIILHHAQPEATTVQGLHGKAGRSVDARLKFITQELVGLAQDCRSPEESKDAHALESK